MSILICGSMAFDTIMVFKDQFKNHILPESIHKLSVAFYVPELRKEFGGTAGNIAFNLKLLDENPVIMATVGSDFSVYFDWLNQNGIDTSYIKEIKSLYTAQAYITTDLSDNQITAFHPGAMVESHQNKIKEVKDVCLAIIAPDGKDGMMNHAKECKALNIPFMFDPGQGLPMFNREELLKFIDDASYIAVNDYEATLLSEKTSLSLEEISKRVEALIVTRGGEGSIIYADHKTYKIEPIKVQSTIDPTGCGDAYRAGLLYGISKKWDWQSTGRLASVMSAIKIQNQGGQNHRPTRDDIEMLYTKKLIEENN
ncbi:carbohydrate kinase family protein [Candidatus Methylopumilus universalis]|uniref:carbohydrate kinase family protein n=1 Tax=Candidatus Methylopumilus universalis TaxID=2588536 RepID=UPI0011234F17|nr:carbohydrate kinase family protein [Candidatus Methylopumilus universalis]QDC88909.1 carbohydrate kinase family protein [Candidatus Methylopumilus universalis]